MDFKKQRNILESQFDTLNNELEKKRNEIKKDEEALKKINGQMKAYKLLEVLHKYSDDEQQEWFTFISEPHIDVDWDECGAEYHHHIDAQLEFTCKYKDEPCNFVVNYTLSEQNSNRGDPYIDSSCNSDKSNLFIDYVYDHLETYSSKELGDFINEYR